MRRTVPVVSLLLLTVLCACQTIGGKDLAYEGESCEDAVCASGLTCAHDATCQPDGAVGTWESGVDCSAAEECAYGLVCSADNRCADPGEPGTGGQGDACSGDSECQAGHFCSDDGACQDIGIPYWTGGPCEADDPDSFRALFAIPRLPASAALDFYSLPYPNDFRRQPSGDLDLSGHPVSPDAPAVQALLGALQAQDDFGLNPTVYFRFSQPVDTASLSALTEGATIRWAALSGGETGERTSLEYFYRTSRGRYICQNWLAVSVYDGLPLQPQTTYAVWLERGVQNNAGDPAGRDEEFDLVMADAAPSGYAQTLAWEAYSPFRDWLDAQGIDRAEVISAAVFTTGNASDRIRYFDDQADDAVRAADLVKCDAGIGSPCDDGAARDCAADPAGYDVLHGRLYAPSYPDSAGEIAWDELDRPVPAGEQPACFALTLPEGAPPAGGWPVAVYTPDLGSTFRASIDSGLAASLAAEGVATLTVELPGHGARGSSYTDPADPVRWRSTRFQHVADLHAAVALLRSLALSAADSPTGADLSFDPDALFLVGLGEGGVAATGALAWSPYLKGGALGNTPGYSMAWLPDTYGPVDIAHGLQSAFADSSIDDHHPVMALLQQYFEPIDPASNAEFLVRDPNTDARHLLVVDGIADDTLPRPALLSTLYALDLPVGGAVIDGDRFTATGLPAEENISTPDGRRTAAILQYDAGHDALLNEAMPALTRFLATGSVGVPIINQ